MFMQQQLGSYDDLSVRARADLTDSELERFKTYELMSAGVVREPRPAILDDEPQAVDLERTSWWEVGPCVFATAEAAEAFLELEPYTAETDWQAGYDNKYAKAVEAGAGGVSQIRLIGRADFESHLGALKDYEAATEARAKARSKYDRNAAEVEKITKGIDDDHWDCKRQVVAAERIVAVFREYVETAAGDEATAAAFLVKAYARDTCAEAFELTRNDELVAFLPAPVVTPEELDALEELADEAVGRHARATHQAEADEAEVDAAEAEHDRARAELEGEAILEAELESEIAEAEAAIDEELATG